MRMAGNQGSIHDLRFNKYCDTTLSTWIRLWCHYTERGASTLPCVHESTDSSFVRCYEQVDYERQLGWVIEGHYASGNRSFRTGLADILGVSCPYGHLYFIFNWLHFGKDADIEYRNRLSERWQYMYNSPNVELFALPSGMRFEYYVKISSSLEEDFELGRRLSFPTPQVLAFYSDVALAVEGNALAILHIAISQYVVLPVLFILAAACHEAVGVSCLDSCRLGMSVV